MRQKRSEMTWKTPKNKKRITERKKEKIAKNKKLGKARKKISILRENWK